MSGIMFLSLNISIFGHQSKSLTEPNKVWSQKSVHCLDTSKYLSIVRKVGDGGEIHSFISLLH